MSDKAWSELLRAAAAVQGITMVDTWDFAEARRFHREVTARYADDGLISPRLEHQDLHARRILDELARDTAAPHLLTEHAMALAEVLMFLAADLGALHFQGADVSDLCGVLTSAGEALCRKAEGAS